MSATANISRSWSDVVSRFFSSFLMRVAHGSQYIYRSAGPCPATAVVRAIKIYAKLRQRSHGRHVGVRTRGGTVQRNVLPRRAMLAHGSVDNVFPGLPRVVHSHAASDHAMRRPSAAYLAVIRGDHGTHLKTCEAWPGS